MQWAFQVQPPQGTRTLGHVAGDVDRGSPATTMWAWAMAIPLQLVLLAVSLVFLSGDSRSNQQLKGKKHVSVFL